MRRSGSACAAGGRSSSAGATSASLHGPTLPRAVACRQVGSAGMPAREMTSGPRDRRARRFAVVGVLAALVAGAWARWTPPATCCAARATAPWLPASAIRRATRPVSPSSSCPRSRSSATLPAPASSSSRSRRPSPSPPPPGWRDAPGGRRAPLPRRGRSRVRLCTTACFATTRTASWSRSGSTSTAPPCPTRSTPGQRSRGSSSSSTRGPRSTPRRDGRAVVARR